MNKHDIDNRALGMPLRAKLASHEAVRLICAALLLSSLALMFRIASIW